MRRSRSGPRIGLGTLARGGALAVALVALIAQAATADVVPVQVIDRHFSPVTARAAMGDTVDWAFLSTNRAGHTVTDTSGMGLFDSGVVQPGGPDFLFVFIAAGAYPYHCSIHAEMVGTISIPMRVKPKTGTVATPFTVTWATSNAPAGFTFTVQIKRPGNPSFQLFQSGPTRKAMFIPDAGPGTYSFQAELVKTAGGSHSGFSPAASMTVS